MAQNLNERQLSGDRTLIAVNEKKTDLNHNLKSGTLQYVMKAADNSIVNELYLTIPESLNNDKYYKLLMLDEAGTFVEDNVEFRNMSATGDMTITGNMTVTGTITSTHTTNLNVSSNYILINDGGVDTSGTGIAAGVGGIQIDRGDDLLADGYFRFRETMNSAVTATPTKGFDVAIGSTVLLSIDEDRRLEVNAINSVTSTIQEGTITNATIPTLNGQLINKDLAFKDHTHYVESDIEPTIANSYNGMLWHNTLNGADYLMSDDKYKKIPTTSNGPTLQVIPFEVLVSADSANVIIPSYDPTKDELIVYLDTEYMHKGADYSINVATHSIDKSTGTFIIGQKIRGIIYKNVKLYTPALVEEPPTNRTAETDISGLIIKNTYRLRSDNSIYRIVEASNPNTEGRYQTITEKIYDPGNILNRTITYTLTYNTEGLCITNDGGIVT